MVCFFVMIRRPPMSTCTDPLFPYTPLFRAQVTAAGGVAGDRHDHLRRDRREHVLEEHQQGDGGVGALLRPGRQAFDHPRLARSEEHTSELPSLMRLSYADFRLTKKKTQQ